MGKQKAVKRRVRICKRTDGTIFTWSPVLDANSGMHPGWLTVFEDGTREVILDVATAKELDSRTMSQREQGLISQNAQLREDLAEARGLVIMADEKSSLLPGESEIETPTASQVGEDEPVVPASDEEEPVVPASPDVYSMSRLNAMRKDKLAVHARSLDPELSVPEHLTKQELVDLCVNLQMKCAPDKADVPKEPEGE